MIPIHRRGLNFVEKMHAYYSVDYATYKEVDKTDDNTYLKISNENSEFYKRKTSVT